MSPINVPACFVFADQVPKETTGLQMALACDKSTPGGIYGTQKIKGLWRIYTWSREARDQLLIKGITINRIHVAVFDTNPNIVDNSTETVKLIIGNVPMSVANAEIEKILKSMSDVSFRSKLFDESYRDEDGKLTSFKSGRRYVYIQKPSKPLPKFVQIMKWKASLYHYGQKASGVNPPTLSISDTTPEPAPAARDSDQVREVARNDDPMSTHQRDPAQNNNPNSIISFFRKTASRVTSPPRKQPSPETTTFPPPSKGPSSPVPTPIGRGRKHERKSRTRHTSKSASSSRKRFPSGDDDTIRTENKARKAEKISVSSPDYFDYDPTLE